MRYGAPVLQSLAVGFVLPSGLSAFGLPNKGAAGGTSSLANSHAGPAAPTFLTRLFSSSSSDEVSKKDQTFPTWSFDEPCASMEWSSLISAEMTLAPVESADKALEADLLVVGIMAPAKPDEEEEKDEEEEDEDKEEPTVELVGMAKELEDAMGGDGILSGLIAENNKAFKNGAKAGSTTPVTRIVVGGQAKRVLFVGLGTTPKESAGDDEKKKPDSIGAAVGKALASQCQNQKKVESCALILPESVSGDAEALQDLSAAFFQSLYADNRYKSKKSKKKIAEDLKSVSILSEGSSVTDEAQAALASGQQLATGILLTKDIVNAPHNVLNSESLAETAKRIAQDSTDGCISCEILDKDECEKRGMGAYLGVARGSETDPQFIHLTYKPKGDVKKKVGIIGKGLLFDTGGYNIKTQMMALMKFDCGGAAAVLGAARAIGAMQPEGVEAHFIVAACENMINAKAMVPSDILTASNGKTIEVLNTDAEGRLTLADALVFADKEVGAESIIELSTLTGACMVSLGKKIAGVWTSNDELASELGEVSKKTGDKSWRMPLENEYMEQITGGQFADLKNIGGPYGGAITAALFLQHFVSKKKPFAHIDIAGPVWDEKEGATGYGAKLVVEWVRRQGL
eukprot:CAMPEP_0172442352 /NCGR_PEP_ID=MMETSP1065-20121228/2809_1 /TAXON_ID=265537 /ORGANISM="Amphiprora paludosa, Strain CCMP125" /LENGTH=628 /DNA_ID=CAMNT_0013192189 /DNA_START=169 /DNA_END=2055 /DNA_ORIENTATION=-